MSLCDSLDIIGMKVSLRVYPQISQIPPIKNLKSPSIRVNLRINNCISLFPIMVFVYLRVILEIMSQRSPSSRTREIVAG